MATSCPPPATLIGQALTEDLINEILQRVPLKSLLRFQLVSKSWLSLISNPSFAKSRLLRTIASSNSDETVIVHSFNEDDGSISLLNLSSRQLVADLKFPYSQGEFSFVPDSILVGSANGIVCVCIAVSDTPPDHNWLCSAFAKRKTNTYLWNPVTKQSKFIPPHIRLENEDEMYRVSLGFGYDPIDDDYKVVKVLSPPFSAEIYSVKRNVWKKVKKPIDIPYDDDFDVCVHGFLCCTGMYGMIAFDLNREVLNCAIKLPVRTFNARIIEFNDSVAVLLANDKESKSNIKLWTLDNEECLRGGGVEASWTPNFSIDLDLSVQFVHGYFNNGDLLVLAEGVWYLYNKDKKESRNVQVSINVRQVYKYTESLVSIAGSKQVMWSVHEDDT